MFLVATILCSISASVLGNCPEGRCKSDETCCPTPTPDYYGCCRMPKATCCPDGKRCCPEGTECGIDQCTVQQPNTFEKRLLQEQHETIADTTSIDHTSEVEETGHITTTESYSSRVKLCNRQSYCPSTYECCVEPSGFYNCCPPNSICCRNSGHCCPEGTLCDLVIGRCRPFNPYAPAQNSPRAINPIEPTAQTANPSDVALEETIPTVQPVFSKRQGLLLKTNSYENEANPNRSYKQSYCPNKYNEYPENVPAQHSPCEDLEPINPLVFSKRQGLIENYDENEANINRCDKQSYCPDEYSCCVRSSGLYGCCPYPNAVCCSDRLHCCQQGEVCVDESRMCVRDEVKMPTLGMEMAVPFLNEDPEL